MHYVLDDRTFVPTNGFRERLAKSLMRRYGLALFFVAVALATTLLLQQLFPCPFLFLFFAAVMTRAWFGGTAPGLFAVLISTLVVDYFFISPFYSLAVKAEEAAYFAAFIACSLVASWVSSFKKKDEETLKETRDQLEVRVAERTAELEKSNTELRESERQLRLLTEVIPQQIWSGTPEVLLSTAISACSTTSAVRRKGCRAKASWKPSIPRTGIVAASLGGKHCQRETPLKASGVCAEATDSTARSSPVVSH